MCCKPIFLVNLILRPQLRLDYLIKSQHALLSETNQYPCNITQILSIKRLVKKIMELQHSQLSQFIHSGSALIRSLNHNSSLKLLDSIGPTNLFQIVKKTRSKDLVNNPFVKCKFCIFAATEIFYHFSIKAFPL